MNRLSLILGAIVLGIGMGGCDNTAAASSPTESTDKTVLRGETALPSDLIFTCDNGKVYEIRSEIYGGGKARFSLSVPQGSVCRLWVSDRTRGTRPVTFSDYRGNLGSLVYLRSNQVDLGLIRFVRNGSIRTPIVSIENNDLQLMVAEGEEGINESEGSEQHFALQ